ncbi:MAG: hypothetical protein QNJ77_11165 [Acidimicrobiia bacterium]|nr:hypothetical protein [Acidimicrobiia bacterium]
MDFCNECGSKTDPDWVFCRACGSSLGTDGDAAAGPVLEAAGPKVELISRGWDVVEVETVDLPADPLTDEEVVEPVAPGAIEVSVDDVTVIEAPDTTETDEPSADEPPTTAEELTESAETVPQADRAEALDRWDHLRPHGQMPELREPTRTPAQAAQIAVLVAALAALVSAVLYLALNIQLDQYATGSTSERAVNDVQRVAEASLLVLAGFAGLALLAIVWWMTKALPIGGFRPKIAGIIALPALGGGAAIVALFATTQPDSVADAMTANSFVVLGLGLVMMGCLAIVRTLTRVELEGRR